MAEMNRRAVVKTLGIALPLGVLSTPFGVSAAEPPVQGTPPPAPVVPPAAAPAPVAPGQTVPTVPAAGAGQAAPVVADPAQVLPAVPAAPVVPPVPDWRPSVLDEAKAKDIIASIKPAVVLIEVETERGMQWGSGFFVSSDGLLITNKHVVDKHQKITCIVRNKQKLSAQVVRVDANFDLALLKVDVPGPVPTAKLGDSDAVHSGQLVGVTGYPEPQYVVYYGMALDSSTSRGSVNGLRYGSEANSFVGDSVLQIDAPATHGNSGGPVFSLDTGEVLGILTWQLGSAGNLTFAVPANAAKVLVSTAGRKLTTNVVAADSKEAIIQPGELKTLNTIGISKELPSLFGYGSPILGANDTTHTETAIHDWLTSSGQQPSFLSPMTFNGDELYWGALDGTLWRCNVANGLAADDRELLLDTGGDGTIFIYSPLVTDSTICAVSNDLQLSQSESSELTLSGVALAALTGGLFGGVSKKTSFSIRGKGHLFGLNRHNGNVDWEIETGFVGTPLLYNGKLFYGGLGERGCVEALQGTPIWRTIPNDEFDKEKWYHVGYASAEGMIALVVPVKGKTRSEENNQLYMYGDGQAYVARYNAATGKEEWKSDEFGYIKDRLHPLSTALYVDPAKAVIYALANQHLAALNLKDGSILWHRDLIKESEEEAKKFKEKKEKYKGLAFAPNMTVHNGIIFVGTTDRRMIALNGADGKEMWSFNTRNVVGAPTYHDGQLIFGSRDRYLYVVDAQTGALNWRVLLKQPIQIAPMVHNGMIYVAMLTGQIFSVRIPIA